MRARTGAERRCWDISLSSLGQKQVHTGASEALFQRLAVVSEVRMRGRVMSNSLSSSSDCSELCCPSILSLRLSLARSAVCRCIHARWQEIIACPPHSTPNKRAVLMRAFLRASLTLSCSPSLAHSLHYFSSPWRAQAHCLGFLQQDFLSLSLFSCCSPGRPGPAGVSRSATVCWMDRSGPSASVRLRRQR